MGVMESVRATEEAGRLVITPSPVLLDGQKNVAADLIPGESLYSFLSRHVDPSEPWEVRIGGVVVPVELWGRIKPKDGQVIEVRGAVNRQAVALVAMVALTYFTFGAGAAAGGIFGTATGAGTFFGASGLAASMLATGTMIAGSVLINKVLTPKPPRARTDERDSVYAIAAARNAARPYEPIALLLGHTRITPDYASRPYTWYEGDDMYVGMVLNVGINVGAVGEIYNGDTLLSSYEGVQVYYNGIPGKPNQAIPLFTNADTVDGGTLDKDGTWVIRTTPMDTVRVQLNIEYILGDQDNKGRDYPNQETVEAQYRAVGSTTWTPLVSRQFRNAQFDPKRATMSRDVARGQYEIRVRRLGQALETHKGRAQFDWTNMVAVQADEATYAGMGRIGIVAKATGQLTNAMDMLRLEAWSKPVPVWTGSAWVTESTSNPGALALQFLRGVKDENGKLIGGVGLTDAEIDIPSLQAFMVHCEANNYTYDHYLTETRSNGDQLDAILRAGFGALSWETGKLGVVWAAAGQPVSGVVNMATIKKGQFQVDYTLAQAADGIEYTYFDRTDWTAKTLRVEAPGVTTMLNPAQVQGEGVTTEEHAAQLARWHLAQSLYQYKDITYSTDLEHLAYKRMDVLQLQHDLTQWGYGGRLVSVSGNTVTLDEPVPPSATAHIGIRIPGEAVYRIMRVANFTGEPRDTVTLLDAWPGDAPLPTAETAQNYIWIYDFKATPGYRVRVVGKTLESDAKGASVAVVPESPEFWTYVKTGEYVPPQGGSLLNTLPKASNVRVSEVQVVTGDVIHTELSVLFDIKGQAARSVIFAGISGTEIRPVAETVTNQARFRIGSAGSYTILVRPYNSEGIAGQSASTTYTTTGADIPPPPFDWFTVTVEPGGLRRYAWGYTQFQPADLAGAEIRFAPGTTPPAWAAMTPLGEDGFFTSAFESDIPESGQWVFSIRARNTSGELSTPIHASLNLTANVGENIEDHEERITTTQQLAQEILSDFADMNQRVSDVQAEAQQAAAALNARADGLRDDIDAEIGRATGAETALGLRADQLRNDIDATMSQLNDILGAEEWDAGTAYDEGALVQFGGKLYRALQAVAAGTPVTDGAYWELLGEYASFGDAVAAALSELSAHADELLAHAESLSLLGASNGAGTAWMLDMDTVRVSATESLAQWRSGLQAQFDDANARIDTESQTRADETSALASQTESLWVSLGDVKIDSGVPTFRQADEPQITGVRRNLFVGTERWNALPSTDSTGAVHEHAGDTPPGFTGPVAEAVKNTDYAYPFWYQYGGGSSAAIAQGEVNTRSWFFKPLVGCRYALGYHVRSWPFRFRYDFVTGEMDVGPNALKATAEEVGNGWWRFSVTQKDPEPGTTRLFVVAGEAESAATPASFLSTGYQTEVGTEVTPYQAVRSATDFDGSGLPVGSIWHKTDANDEVIQTLRYNGATWDDVSDSSKASVQSVTDITLRVDETEDGITALGQRADTLEATVNDPDTGLPSKASNTRVDTVESNLDEATGDLTALSETMSLLGAETADGQGFIFDLARTRVSVEETFGQRLAGIQSAFGDVNSRVDDEVQARSDAVGGLASRTQAMEVRMPAGSGELGTAQAVQTAQDAAQAASNLAGGKGKVFFQNSAPSAADRLPQNLWIDTTGGANTPKRWVSGSTWAPVTDKAATDAAAAAAAALSHSQTVDARVTTVEQASVGRDNALAQRTEAMEVRMPTGTGGLATAQSVTQVTNRVSDVEDTVEAHTGQLATHTAAIAGKANSSTVTALDNYVKQDVDGRIEAQGTQLSGLSAEVGGYSASINEAREIAVSAVAGNAVINPSFETDEGWQFAGGNVYYHATSTAHTGARVLRFDPGSGHAISTSRINVTTGQRLRMGGIMRPQGGVPNAGSRLQLIARRYTADNQLITFDTVAEFTPPSSYVQTPFEAIYTVPEGTGRVAYQLSTASHSSGGIGIDDVYLEPESSTVAEMMSKYTLAVQAGGDVAGMQLLAGGGISAIRFLANMFSIVNPGGTNGWEFDGATGRQVTRGGSYMKVEGAPFGPGNQFLWGIWPEMNLSQLSTSNAKIAVDVNGAVIVNGAFVTGQIRNATQGTLNNTTDYIELGPYATVGNNKQITASLFRSQQVSNQGQTGALSVEGSLAVNYRLQRAIGNGSFSNVGTGTMTLTWSPISTESGSMYSTASGASNITYTDTHSSLDDRTYRMQITGSSGTMRWRIGSGSWTNISAAGQASLLSLENP